ncbi:MAG: DUF4214 domain-containing protein [Bryobacteraceae bacterium]|nr:DUF4214 domain-containing protein [Bryobacteraceae bacterium]
MALNNLADTLNRIGERLENALLGPPPDQEHWADAEALLALDGEEFVAAAYRLLLGRQVEPEGLAFHAGRLAAGELTKVQWLLALSNTPEARAAKPVLLGWSALPPDSASMTDGAWVAALCVHLHGEEPHPDSLIRWVSLLEAGAVTRGQVRQYLSLCGSPANALPGSAIPGELSRIRRTTSDMKRQLQWHEQALHWLHRSQ